MTKTNRFVQAAADAAASVGLAEPTDPPYWCGYNPEPPTLSELVVQCQVWDGTVTKIVPYFDDQNRLESVGVFVDDEQLDGGEYEQVWHLRHGKWVMSGDGAGDPCTNGGSVLTGRDLG